MNDPWLRRFVVVAIIIVSSLIALFTIGAAILHPYYSTDTTPTILENWGGLIIGFYFGTFVGLLKDWLGTRNFEPESTQLKGDPPSDRPQVVSKSTGAPMSTTQPEENRTPKEVKKNAD